jgi:isopenicillin N synthase-like dioxygenase
MKYTARSSQENSLLEDVWAKSHTDFGSLTLLFRQPVAALQVQTGDGSWKYVKPLPGSITVNVADTLQFWTNGFLKSSVHRVVAPPKDQSHIDRLGLLYMLRPENDDDLSPIQSPILERLGLQKPETETKGLKGGAWVKARVAGNLDTKIAYLDEKDFLAQVFTSKSVKAN